MWDSKWNSKGCPFTHFTNAKWRFIVFGRKVFYEFWRLQNKTQDRRKWNTPHSRRLCPNFVFFFSRWWKPLRKRNSDMLGFPAYRYVLLLLLWYTGRVSCVSPPGYARVFSGPRFDSSVCKHLFQASRARTIISLFFFFFFFFLYILKASTRGEVGKTIARMLWILTRKFIFFFFYILTILRGYKRLPWPQHTRARAPGPSVGKLRIRNALVPDSGTNRMGRQFNNAGVRHICTWRRPFSTKRMVEQEKRVECDCADEKRGDRHP